MQRLGIVVEKRMDLEVNHLTKRYGPQKAVDDISFGVKAGEIVGFLGPNGAGKTTTMQIISGYMAPTSGNVTVGNLSRDEDIEEIKQHIGYLPENNPLYGEMQVMDFLAFIAGIQGVPSHRVDERVAEMIRVCGLNEEKHKKIRELSKGYQQRTGLAQSMIHDPEVLILDEPTTGLDPNQIVEIRGLIKELGKEKTVILSTHILPEVEATCDRILIINDGRIVADGSAETLIQQKGGEEEVKIAVEGADGDEVVSGLQALETVRMVDPLQEEEEAFLVRGQDERSARREIFGLCASKGWTLLEMTPRQRSLEDVFRNLTTKE